VDVRSSDLPQHNVEVSRLISVELEVGLGGDVHSANSPPRRRITIDQLVRTLAAVRLDVVGGQLWTETTHDDRRHDCKLTDRSTASTADTSRDSSYFDRK